MIGILHVLMCCLEMLELESLVLCCAF
ncbi:hypothetical protein Patl1_30292 [Pistacia atlantica]|uniref:Uncharacterized protein n=1 Tax=Pistacia atlantica TaxID=434234 RepID=A0ACC1AD53_9ROSI|nr:hypothetical protein Patl1_30292 [Pistacia atlantica]